MSRERERERSECTVWNEKQTPKIERENTTRGVRERFASDARADT